MRRLITVIMCMAVTAALTSGIAQARAVDPVAALAKQLKSGHGVHFTSVSKTNPSYGIKTRSYGDLQFGRSQVAASNIITTVDYGTMTKAAEEVAELLGLDPDKITGSTQTITLKDDNYVTGGITDIFLPEGKTWLKSENVLTQPGLGGSAINVLSPRELKALLAKAQGKKAGGTVDGVATTLYNGAEVFRLELGGDKFAIKLNWKVWIGANDGLIRRVAANENLVLTPKKGKPIKLQLSSDTYLSGWGDKVWIYAPDERLVADLKEILLLPPSVLGTIDLGD
ncbi:hypothetical protein GCM10009555_022760 [Acrocarpospora macrocephala]|uniref:Uncharacterized protein n=1 Tax=Acrocarpospora macrocephala TaxID=150177 RepID=A0A5M3X1M5_9ACTN|nr:hypothetical protein [Acrocarpospora macrocephala]GES12208.1 hypothetical protein Amac_058050 [Acrocarpospora macrocephala]